MRRFGLRTRRIQRVVSAQTIGYGLHTAITLGGGTVLFARDLRRNITVSGGKCSSCTQLVGGSASDISVQATPSKQPAYGADARLGGREAISCTVAEFMQSADPLTAFDVPQPYYLALVCGPPTSSGYLLASADATKRGDVYLAGTPLTWRPTAGASWSSGIQSDATKGAVVVILFNGASTTIRVRKSDGTLQSAGPGDAGTNNIKGDTMLVYSNGTTGPAIGGSVSAFAIWTGGTEATVLAAIDAWSALPASQEGCGFTIP